MTSEAEGSDVFNSAFTAAFDDRHNMVGRPGADKWLEPWELQPKHIERPVTLRLAFNFRGNCAALSPAFRSNALKTLRTLSQSVPQSAQTPKSR